jgi:hypothetical protein
MREDTPVTIEIGRCGIIGHLCYPIWNVHLWQALVSARLRLDPPENLQKLQLWPQAPKEQSLNLDEDTSAPPCREPFGVARSYRQGKAELCVMIEG